MCIICNQGFFDSTMLKQTSVLPFKNIKSCFFNNRRIMPEASAEGTSHCAGWGKGWGPVPSENFEILML